MCSHAMEPDLPARGMEWSFLPVIVKMEREPEGEFAEMVQEKMTRCFCDCAMKPDGEGFLLSMAVVNENGALVLTSGTPITKVNDIKRATAAHNELFFIFTPIFECLGWDGQPRSMIIFI